MKQELIIGKYTLESLTNGLYASPLDLYREYIQNAVDSIDDAIEQKVGSGEKYYIDILIDDRKNTLSIKDNGCGIKTGRAVQTLIDIGNSRKCRSFNRGFRGIGRLAGLGYCTRLIFATSAIGEEEKTIVEFDAKLLKELLLKNDQSSVSVHDVLERVISTKKEPEAMKKHYFEVNLVGASVSNGLMDVETVTNYLAQHAPLPYSKSFKWQSPIKEKVRIAGYTIPNYTLRLNGTELYKPYQDRFISDRVKKVSDSIKDVIVKPFYRGEILSAVLWYAQSSFYGTLTDNFIKGIRIRQGNILIGDRTTCNKFFKEERFNGWLIGELHVVDPDIIVNTRRDDFERNEAYYVLVEQFKEWAMSISKEIRKISYERSLSREKRAIIEAQTIEDVDDLCCEELYIDENTTESDYLDSGESETVAETDYFGKLSFLLDQKKAQTKYTALNINKKLTMEQRKTLERVFDVIQQEYDKRMSEQFITTIARLY